MTFAGWRIGTLALAASLALAGCGGGSEETVSSGGSPKTGETPAEGVPPGGGSAPPEASGNTAPVVSGSPAGTAVAGQAWVFQPTAQDPDGDPITWSISGKPADAAFSTATGQLSWTPTSAGSWTGIVITATDSHGASASLPPFSIVVDATPPSGTATLSWDMPQHYADGTPLSADDQVAGYRVYHGTREDALDEVIPVNEPTTLQYTASGLPPGTHYFAVAAISIHGIEGERSQVLGKTVM
jgi:hypothetical protein